ncbi:hypothetical protein [Mariprofundus micogutta]|uniref:hypothetical protein n=1 Tax=Mariprofundus micogutta TaxID=1921010 RepID=UPI001160713D|nr:hypothetical protein [Mariprofundus micogutta]
MTELFVPTFPEKKRSKENCPAICFSLRIYRSMGRTLFDSSLAWLSPFGRAKARPNLLSCRFVFTAKERGMLSFSRVVTIECIYLTGIKSFLQAWLPLMRDKPKKSPLPIFKRSAEDFD